MTAEIVTYANKSQGMFEDLVNNEFGVPVKVLGWGTKWNGYSDKSKGLLEYMKTKNDEDIIVFVDGFDSKISKPITDVVKIFKQCNCRVLLSKDPENFSYLGTLIFGQCKNSGMGNAGMYMGYVKELTIMLQDEANEKCLDDQVNLNNLCQKHNFISVDTDEKIFKNFGPMDKKHESDAIFVSYPGSPGFNRYTRAVVEYTQFIYIYILCLLVLSLAVFPQRQRILVTTLVLFTGFYALIADRSCTTPQVQQP
jgi:hypothetical protein